MVYIEGTILTDPIGNEMNTRSIMEIVEAAQNWACHINDALFLALVCIYTILQMHIHRTELVKVSA